MLLPAALGLLGFLEPCTVGSHLIFLGSLKGQTISRKLGSTILFTIFRTCVIGLSGILIVFLGKSLIGAQTWIWLIFGLIYMSIGLLYLAGRDGRIKKRLTFSPASWRRMKNPAILGLAFGLNIPACAAPILFGLLGLSATSGTLLSGFTMMAVFGFFLSSPLILMALFPKVATWMEKVGEKLLHKGKILGGLFVLLGVWSVWFGLFVDPVDWSRI